MRAISHPSNIRKFTVFGGSLEIDAKMPESVSFTSKLGDVFCGMCSAADYLTNIKEFGSPFEERSAQPVSFSQKSEFSIELNFQVFGLSGMPRDVSILVMRDDPNDWIRPPGGAIVDIWPPIGAAPAYDSNVMDNEEIARLKRANDCLNNSLLATKKQYASSCRRNTELEKKIANTQSVPELEDRLTAQNLKITDLTLQLKDAGKFQSEYYDLCKKNNYQRNEIRSLNQTIINRNTQITTLTEKINLSEQRAIELDQNLFDASKRIGQLEDDLDTNRLELADLDRKLNIKIDDLEEQLRASQLTNAELRVSLESKSNTTVDGLEEQLRLSQLEVFKLQEKLARKTTVEQNLVEKYAQNGVISRSLAYLEQKYSALIKRFEKTDSEKKRFERIHELYLFQCEEIKAYKQVVRRMDTIKCGTCERSLITDPEVFISSVEQPRADFYANEESVHDDVLRGDAE